MRCCPRRRSGLDPDALADELLRTDLAPSDGQDLEVTLQSLAELRARLPEIDGLIGKHTQHWRMDRMATVDRNVLRGAVAELLGYPATPRAVVINEALEIARKFSTPESVQFINGVLDSVGKEVGL